MAGWATLKWLVREEINQKREEGCNVDGFIELWQDAGDDDGKLMNVYEKLSSLIPSPDFKYDEPSEYEDIIKLADRNVPAKTIDYESDETKDKFYGAWLGRSAGCALGKPFETHPFTGGTKERSGASFVKQWYEGANEWPIKGYAPENSSAKDSADKLWIGCPKSHRENIKYMETDDDIRYMVLALLITEGRGKDLDQWDVGNYWHSYLTYSDVCTAETQAYLNFAHMKSHTSGRPSDPAEVKKAIEYTRNYLNPYREWIGAQIRIDIYAYAAAGDPELAARMAYMDSSFSHIKNGIYGAMYTAGVIAAAFTEKEPMKCIEAGLAQIPKTSRTYEAVVNAIKHTESSNTMEEMQEKIWNEHKGYNWVHTIPNAAMCTGAFLWSEGDFEKGIVAAVSGGLDTDCNGATVGSMVGAMNGAKKIPDTWKAPLNDTMYSFIPGFHPIAISECARRTLECAKKIRG